MHLDKAAEQPQLVVENKGEVIFVNEALGLAGYPLKDGESITDTPTPVDGDYPRTLDPRDSAVVMGIMERVTVSKSGVAREALSEPVRPVDRKFVEIARLAVYLSLHGDFKTVKRRVDKIMRDSALVAAQSKTKLKPSGNS